MKKKTEEKKKEKIFKDSTFGMKNKGKSKTVQKEIQGMRQGMDGGVSKEKRKEMEEKEKKKLEKLAEKQREKELSLLFRKLDTKEGEEVKVESVEELSEQIEEEIKDESEMTLEEIVEQQRSKIIEGTKITLETFTKWKEFKKQQKEKEEERKRKLMEQTFKKTGSGLSGKALFEINANIFIDDEDAADLDEYKINEELDIDGDIFLEVEDKVDVKEFKVKEEDSLVVEEYDPATWKDPKTPKALLQEYLSAKGVSEKDAPIYSGGERESICGISLPHVGVDLKNKKGYKLKKIAEHNAALLGMAYLKSKEKK